MQSNSLSIRLYNTLQKNPLFYVYLPLCVYWILLFILTTIPPDKIPQVFSYQDKIEHFIAYLILSFLLMLSLHFQKKNEMVSRKSFLFTIIFLIAYATIDEVHQIYIPGRYCDITDWLADVTGGIIGIIFSNYFIRFNEITLKNK